MTDRTNALGDLPRRALRLQKGAVDNGFNVYSRAEDRSRDVTQRWLEQVPNLPEELRLVSDAWWQARVNARETWKSAVDRSFQLLDGYYDRVTSRSA